MEEPQEVHTDENRAIPEKKHKRIVKTASQVTALENFYNHHKYPTEAMKLEVAESIGLTEKQVSGWFCHRRLKDKKSPNDEIQSHGKQDRSSGVIQDRGSGLRQDSCGSTKQGDTKHYDPKEVESRRFTTETRSLRFDHESQHNNIMHDHDDNDDDDDETSSGSSSRLKNNFDPQNVDVLGTLTPKYPINIDLKNVKARTGPSGYLKVKGRVENAAITAVKRQLGRHYLQDGPPLGIEFDPLPPGAFEEPVKIPVNQSYYVGDRTALHPPDGSRTFQLPNPSKAYERYNRKSCHPLDLDESGLDTRHASKHHEKHSNRQYNQTPPFPKHRHSLSARTMHMEIEDEPVLEASVPVLEASVYDVRDHFEPRIKHGPVVRRPDSLSSHHLTAYGKNTDDMEAENYPRGHNSGPTKINYIDRIQPLTSELNVKRGEFVEFEDRGLSRKTVNKDDEFDGERRGIGEYSKLVSTKIYPGNEMRITKRGRDEFTHQGYPRKEAMIDFPPRTNNAKRSTAQRTASFSDDETAETTSSGD